MFFTGGGAWAGLGTWDSAGPYVQSAWRIVGKPDDANTAYAVLQGGGFVKTTDSGAHWSDPLLLREVVGSLAMPASDGQRLYVLASGTLMVSSDGGSNWTRSVLPDGGLGNLTPAPASTSVLYGSSQGMVWKSIDGGASWSEMLSLPAGVNVLAVAVTAAEPGSVWVMTSQGIQRSIDGGVNWALTGTGLVGQFISRLMAAPSDARVLYAAGGGGVFRSGDGGANWQRLGTLSTAISQIVIDPLDANHVYVATADRGLLQTRNGGALWQLDNQGLTDTDVASLSYAGPAGVQYLLTARSGVWRRASADAPWAAVGPLGPLASVRSVLWGDRNADRLLAGTDAGIYLSDDRGATWRYGYGSMGGARIAALVRRSDQAAIYALATGGVYESRDQGASWRSIRSDLPAALTLQALAVSAASPNNLYVGTATGLWRSVNDGASWRALGLEEHSITAVAVDPLQPDTLYAATAAGRVFKSIDSGARWEEAGTSADGPAATALLIDAQVRDLVYLGTAEGMKVSRDAGASWTAAGGALATAAVNALCADTAGTVLYAATAEGVFRSVNRAQSWVALSDGLAVTQVQSAAISPGDATQLAVGLDNGGVAVGQYAFVPEPAPGPPAPDSGGGGGGGGGAANPDTIALVLLAWLLRRRYNSRPCQETPSACSSR